MTCKVITVRELAPTLIRTGPDGKLADTKNITVECAQTFGLETSQSLTLHCLQSSEIYFLWKSLYKRSTIFADIALCYKVDIARCLQG